MNGLILMESNIERFEDKNSFMDKFESLRPDLFFPDEWTDEQKEKIDKLNRGIDDRKELDQEIKHQILEEYRKDIKSLEALTNRKLNNWMQ